MHHQAAEGEADAAEARRADPRDGAQAEEAGGRGQASPGARQGHVAQLLRIHRSPELGKKKLI